MGHRLAKKRVTAREFAKADHVSVSRRGRTHGPIDDRLAELGLRRRVLAVVPGQSAALDLVRETDLVCLVPAPLEPARLHTFAVPVELPPLTISMAWHPRNDGDPAHRWLRTNVREVLSGML